MKSNALKIIGVILALSVFMFVPAPETQARYSPSYADTKLVMSKATKKPKQFITIGELVDIYTRRKTHWEDRSEIVVIAYRDNSAEQGLFLADVLGMTPFQYKSKVKQNVLQGKAKPIIRVRSEEELIDKITTIPGSIGYIFNYVLFMEDQRLVIINVENY